MAQDIGTIGSWTPGRLTRYIQSEVEKRSQVAKSGLSCDTLFVHQSLTFTSGDFHSTDTEVTRPMTGVLAINNVPIVTAPVGTVMLTASGIPPSNWLLANGASLAVSAYPLLFAAIGYTYGGAGANFSLPNIADPLAGVKYIIKAI